MPKPKRKTLPKNFDDLLKAGDLAALKAVFDACELDAHNGYDQETALSLYGCPDDLTRWLVAQGADIEARDRYKRTALHNRAGRRAGKVAILLELGADPHALDYLGDTPLHAAVQAANLQAVRDLLAHGARPDVRGSMQLTPLEAGLQCCSNIDIEAMVEVAPLLLPARPEPASGLGGLLARALGRRQPAAITPRMQDFVRRIGETFEFHRQGYNPASVDAVSAALDRLYALFDVPPVPRRVLHDGKAPIRARSAGWPDQHQELWELLVPSKGAAATVQGEVIRITGRMGNEIEGNGGINWDADYRKMGKALLAHLASGAPLPPADLEHAAICVAQARTRDGACADLSELAVRWVGLNPTPTRLAPPDYGR